MRKAPKWGWILITDDEGTSGEASVGSIQRSSQCSGSSCYPRGFAGSSAVFSPPSAQRGYLLIHELGHQFGLNHSGLYKNGQFYEWSELKQSLTGDWLGGRSSHFDDYKWIRSQTKYSTSWQDPVQIIGSIAGTVDDGGGSGGGSSGGGSGGGSSGGGSGGGSSGGGSCHTVPLNDSSYCTSGCRCNQGEGDCDSDSQCASGLVCEERGAVDLCVKPQGGGGGSCHTVPRNDSNYCTSGCRCNEGEGDCDSDSQCASGLVCEERGAVDLCVKPQSGGGSCHTVPRNDSDYCTSSCRCNQGEGDCDSSSQCASGLTCVQRSGTDFCQRR
jgi:hypothetical protein